MEDEYEEPDLGTQLLVEAVGYLLKDYEGIIVHKDGEGYCLWKNPDTEMIEVMHDTDFLEFESGRQTWMHCADSTAPAPTFEDDVVGDVPRVDPKKLN